MAVARMPATIALPELNLTAFAAPDAALDLPGMRVAYESASAMGDAWWVHHRKYASMQVRDTIAEKAAKTYDEPSIVVIDVSRLGEISRSDDAGWHAALTAELESADLGNVEGVLIVRTVLTSREIVPLAWRGPDSLVCAVTAILAGDQIDL